MKTRECKSCCNTYPLTKEFFPIHKGCKEGFRSYCNKCYSNKKKEYQNNWRKKSKSKERRYYLKKNYGISIKEFDERLNKQNNRCAICGIHIKELNENLCVDHNHRTGEIRGLLCRTCNRAIGLFKENVFIFIKIIKYLGDES